MENSSSTSLDASFLLDEDTSGGLPAKQPMQNFVDEVAADEFTRTQAAARWARRYDPQSYAEAKKLAPGVDPEVGVRQLQLIKDNASLQAYQEVFDKSPQMRGYFAEQPKDLPLAHPDELDNISGLSYLGAAGYEAFAGGYLQYQAAMASNRIAAGKGSISDQAIVANYQGDRTYGADSFFTEGYVMAAQQLPQMGLTLLESVDKGLKGGLAGGVFGAATGSAVPGLGTAAGAVAGAGVGATAGASAGALRFQQQLQTGLSRLYFQQIRDEVGKPLDPQLVEFAAQTTGAGGALLENVAFAQLVHVIPGGDRVLGLVTKEGMAQALKVPAVRGALLSFVKNTGESVATEVTTEMMQQGLQIAAGEIAKANSDGKFATMTPEEIAGEIAQAGYQAAQVSILLGGAAAGTRFAGDLTNISRSKRGLDELTKTLQHLEGNKLIERAPDLTAKLIDQQTQNQKLYLPAQEVAALYQSQGLDLYGPPIPNWRDRVDTALATGGDIEVSIGEFASYLSRDPKENTLLSLVRTDPSGFTMAEIQPYSDALNEILGNEISKAQAVDPNAPAAAAAAKPIETFPELDALKKQIQKAGFTSQATEQYSTLLGAFFQTMANRTGRSPSDFFNEFMLSVMGGTLNTAEQGAPNPDQFFQEAVRPTVERESLTQALGNVTDEAQLQQDKKGSIQFDGTKATVQLYDGHNLSTLLHESGHFFLNTLRAVSNASPELQQDWALVKKALKIEGEQISRDQHEKFAKMAEAYFMEGKSPTPELRSAFAAFARWLKTLYRNIRQLGGRVSPEISGVFDRMLATDQRLAELETDTAYAPLFRSAEQMGVSPEDYISYQKLAEELRSEAQEKARERIVGQTERLAKGWKGQIQKQFQAEAETRLASQPPYSHLETLRNGQVPISVEAFSKRYGPEAAKKFPKGTFKKHGLDPDVAAELLGYPTADDMVYDFVQAPKLKDRAKELAEQDMQAKYGENFDNSEVMDVAIKRAMAEDARTLLLAKELQALKSKEGSGKQVRPNQAQQLARRIARDTVYAKKVGELNERQTQASVRRSAAMAEAAMVKAKWAEAADWKRKQLLAQAIDNETQKVNEVVNKIRDKAARYTRTAPKGIDPSFMEQIRALVEQYDFARVSGKKLNKRQSLREFLDTQTEDGLVTLEIPDRLLRDAGKVNWKELSVEDLIGLGETLDNLEHLGRTKNKLKTAQGQREFNEVKQAVINQVRSLPERKTRMKNYAEEQKSIRDYLIGFHSTLLKPEQIIEWLDAGNIKGPLMEHIFQPIVEAQNTQNELNLEYNKRIIEAFEGIDSSYLTETVNIPSLATKMTREQIFAVALNTGNESNRKKLLEGELWNEGQLADVLQNMSGDDWKTVQKVWNTLDSLWERIAAMQKRLTGVAPPKIEARSFTNEHGTFEGGYYPVVYDFQTRRGLNLIQDTTPIDKQFANGLFNNDYIRPGTNQKHTVKRTKVAKPIKLQLGVLPGHLNNVIHDLAYREPVRSAYKVLWDTDVRQSIIDTEGKDTHEQLQHWLRSVATERSDTLDAWSKKVQRVRTGATLFGMGFRLTTALAQPLGFFNSLIRVKGRYLASGIYQMSRHPFQTLDTVNKLSGEMKARFNTQDRDIHDTIKKLAISDIRLDRVRAFSFYMIGAADKYVSTATWLGAYQEYISQHPTDEPAAIMHADRTVRLSQGTGLVKDMAKITNSGELLKLFTMFYSAFSASYNSAADLTRKTGRDINAGDWGTILTTRLPQWAYLVVFPAIFGALATGDTPDDDESTAEWMARKVLFYPTSFVPFVRDIVGVAASGYGYKFSPAQKFYESTANAVAALLGNNDKTVDERMKAAVKPLATAGAIYFHLPAGQAISSVEALWKGLENGDFKPQDIVLGRRDR